LPPIFLIYKDALPLTASFHPNITYSTLNQLVII